MAGHRPPSRDRPRLTPRETVIAAPAPDLSAQIERARARAGAAAHRAPAPEPDLVEVTQHPDAAVALVRSVFPVAEVTTFVDRGDAGWVALGTGERAAWE